MQMQRPGILFIFLLYQVLRERQLHCFSRRDHTSVQIRGSHPLLSLVAMISDSWTEITIISGS